MEKEESAAQTEAASKKESAEHTEASEEANATEVMEVSEETKVSEKSKTAEESKPEPEVSKKAEEPGAKAESVEEADTTNTEGAEATKTTIAETAAPVTESKGSVQVSDVIAMENPQYKTHKKSITQFTHKKHIEDYAITCGTCHHDGEGQPLNDLKMGDPVEKCSACHSNTAKTPKGISNAEKLKYHKETLHQNCIKCHKTYNKENNTKAAPASCTQCHPKKK